MSTFAQLQTELHKITRLLPSTTSDPMVQSSILELRRLEGELARMTLRPTAGAPALSPTAGAPAYVQLALAPVAAVLYMMLQAIVVVLIAVAALILIWYLAQALAGAIHSLILLIQSAITHVTEARTRVQEIVRMHPRAALCMPHFDTIISILNRMATRLNSPVASNPTRQFYQGLLQIGQELLTSLEALIQCLDPTDSLGLKNLFFGRNGLIVQALRQIRALVER